MDKFKNKYRIQSARLRNWDYGWNALYFVTICTKDRQCFFGNIEDGKMKLTNIGEMAQKYWFEIPEHFPFVKLDAFVVMPNHIHGIIEIAKKNDERNVDGCNDDGCNVETQNFASLPPTVPPTDSKPKNKFGPQSKNLASIIRGYKIGVTKNAKQYEKTQNIVSIPFKWQPRYHDHIIRNDKSYHNIKNYIINNPAKWQADKFNTENPKTDR